MTWGTNRVRPGAARGALGIRTFSILLPPLFPRQGLLGRDTHGTLTGHSGELGLIRLILGDFFGQ